MPIGSFPGLGLPYAYPGRGGNVLTGASGNLPYPRQQNTVRPNDPYENTPYDEAARAAQSYQGLPQNVLDYLGHRAATPSDPIYGIESEVYENISRRLNPDNPEFDISDLASRIFEGGAAPLRRERERTQDANVARLERAGLATSGAGYAPSSTYGLTEGRFMDTMSDLSNSSYLNAMNVGMGREQQALQNAMGLWQFREQMGQAQLAREWQRQMYNQQRQDAGDAANSALWGGLGQGLFGLAGTLGGAAIGGPPGAAFGGQLGGTVGRMQSLF